MLITMKCVFPIKIFLKLRAFTLSYNAIFAFGRTATYYYLIFASVLFFAFIGTCSLLVCGQRVHSQQGFIL